jgi:hypothetical protein
VRHLRGNGEPVQDHRQQECLRGRDEGEGGGLAGLRILQGDYECR